jgi:uncharacterized secreted protein with C-terminal beta-propeller domain
MKSVVTQSSRNYQYKFTELRNTTPGLLVAAASSSVTPSFTSTNIQVEGVDEPDSVKTNGAYLYVASGSTVSVILAYPPDKNAITTQLGYAGQVLGLFLAQNRLVVIEDAQNYPNGTYLRRVSLHLYDVSNSSRPSLIKTIAVDGVYVNSRLTNGYVYAILQQQTELPDARGNMSFTPPSVVDGKVTQTIQPLDVHYNPNSTAPFSVYTIILSMSVVDGSHSENVVLTGWGSTIYSSTSNIYLTSPEMSIPIMRGAMAPSGAGDMAVFRPIWWRPDTNTTIFRISFSGGQTQVAAEGTISGGILNQFSLDEYQGYLRVATTSYRQLLNQSGVQVNNIYVLDQSLRVVGALEGLAPKEKIYSVRFLGDIGYVVTFEQIDPLFAISFSDPTHPVVLSALKLTGFSDYLHPLGNGYLVGVGKQTVPAPNEVGYVLYQGLKLSLFHVYDNGSSNEVARYLIGDRGSDSPVLHDQRAFVYDAEKGIMALPFLVTQVNDSSNGGSSSPYAYGAPVWQGAYLFKVSTRSGFQPIGRITQIPRGGSVDGSPDYYINRIVIIGDYVYTISNRTVLINDLSSLTQVAAIQLIA